MKRIFKYICVSLAFLVPFNPVVSADLSPLSLDSQLNTNSLDDYNKPVAATKVLDSTNFADLNIIYDKNLLYNFSFAASDALSNPLILLLINDNSALEDNKSYADAILKPDMHPWKDDKRLNPLLLKAKKEIANQKSISKTTMASIKELVNEYYIVPVDQIGEQIVVNIDIQPVHFDHFPQKYRKSAEHIVENWKNLVRKTPDRTKSSLIPLPNAYIVPGGRFREIYYWDSYFTILGLELSGLDYLAKDMVENFLYLVKKFGFVPNGNRIYYLSRSQPPFLAMMVDEVKPEDLSINENKMWLENAYNIVTSEYKNNWMNPDTHYVSSIGLNRYYDAIDQKRPESWGNDNLTTTNTPSFYQNERAECESGWDFSNRFNQKAMNYIPVDLNSLLYMNEKVFEKWALLLNKDSEAQYWNKQADHRKELMNKYLWNADDGFYYDYDYVDKVQSSYKSIAAIFPLWADIASVDQAKDVKDIIVNYFEFNGGIVTALDKSHARLQWNYPNGWPPLQWITIDSLNKYGFKSDAKRIADKWLELNLKYYESTGMFLEKYNVVDLTVNTTGSYPNQDGFGWTNGVYLKLLDTFY
ncbi:MAG: trehalase family glycosidase [Vampirovibrionia bacterium]